MRDYYDVLPRPSAVFVVDDRIRTSEMEHLYIAVTSDNTGFPKPIVKSESDMTIIGQTLRVYLTDTEVADLRRNSDWVVCRFGCIMFDGRHLCTEICRIHTNLLFPSTVFGDVPYDDCDDIWYEARPDDCELTEPALARSQNSEVAPA